MFFSSVLFTKRGSLAKVWLAAHHQDKRLTKAVVVSTNIEECSQELSQPATPLALRLSGQLLLGVVRIYQRKVKYLQEDTQDALTKVKMSFRPGAGALELPASSAMASSAQITLGDVPDNEFDFDIPDIPLDCLDQFQDDNFGHEVARASDITLEEDNYAYLTQSQAFNNIEDQVDPLIGMEEEDIINMEPLDHSRFLDESIEIPRDAHPDLEEQLVPIDIVIDESFDLAGKDNPADNALDHNLAEMQDISMNINEDNDFMHVDGDVVDAPVVDDLGSLNEVQIAVKAARKRKRPEKSDSTTQITSSEVMEESTSQLVLGKRETLDDRQISQNLLCSGSGSLPSWITRPSVNLSDQLTEFVALCFESNVNSESNDVPSQPDEVQFEDNVDFAFTDDREEVEFMADAEYNAECNAISDQPELEEHGFDESAFTVNDQPEVEFVEPLSMERDVIVSSKLDDQIQGLVENEDFEDDPATENIEKPSSFSNWSERTKKMYVVLSNQLPTQESSITLQPLIQGKSRTVAAAIFLETLILKTHGFIEIQQETPYGDIRIGRAEQFNETPLPDMISVSG